MKTGIVDYKAGNLRSVELALKYLAVDYVVADAPGLLEGVDRLIFPGVGEANSAMRVLEATGFDAYIRDFAASGKPLLGICLGCQILMNASDERDTRCLGVFPGEVRRFPARPGLKVPHMGWNQVYQRGRHPVFEGIPDGASFYFVHSYYVEPGAADIEIASTDYGGFFTSGVARDNVVAFQFHPEKSGELGLKLLANFFRL
ncbi:MAG: imidazole glycerol phosphate synthase subunit HisH [Spirochaetales bacterium]|nr:imidazole glycerol phosphate synthase subunit HisH [Spirochaetales bacterium]